VHRGPPRWLCVEGLVGQRQVATGDVGKQPADVGVAQPDQRTAWMLLGAGRVEHPGEFRADAAGAVVEQGGQVVAQAAAGA